jgi:hypothetical protein
MESVGRLDLSERISNLDYVSLIDRYSKYFDQNYKASYEFYKLKSKQLQYFGVFELERKPISFNCCVNSLNS